MIRTQSIGEQMHSPPSFNFGIIWKRKRLAIRSGFYFSILALVVFLNSAWDTTYEAMIRIEPELSTTGELTSIEAEMDVLQSWAIVSQAVQQMNRTVVVRPVRSKFLLHLQYYADYFLQPFSKKQIADFASYQPSITIEYFNISGDAATYIGQKFIVQVDDANQYTVLNSDGNKLCAGAIASSLECPLTVGGQQLQMIISGINADPGELFELMPMEFDDYAKKIQSSLQVYRKGFRERSGLMLAQYTDHDPVFARQFLDALATTYINKAYDRSSLGKIKGLDKLKEKSEYLKAQLDAAQKELTDFKDSNNLVDITEDRENGYKNLAYIQNELQKAEAKYKLSAANLTDNHPSMIALTNQIQYLQKELQRYVMLLKELPEKEKEQDRLQNNIDIARAMLDKNTMLVSQLYSEIETITGYATLTSLHEYEKLTPIIRGIAVVVMGFGFGAMLALSWLMRHTAPAFARIRYDEDFTGISSLPVVARFPFRWRGTQWLWYRKRNAATVVTEREWKEKSIAEIEKLEKSIPFLIPENAHPVLFFTSVDDREGSHFSASQMAHISARHSKTLLIDAQVAEPLFLATNVIDSKGLTDVLIGQAESKNVIRQTEENLFVLSAGTQTYDYRLICDSTRMQALLESLAKEFDRIIIDFPAINSAICESKILHSASAVFIIIRRDTLTRKVETALQNCEVDSLKSAFFILNKK